MTGFPEFKADPRGWAIVMLGALMEVKLWRKDRAYVVRQRELLQTDEGRIPGPNLHEALCRIARRHGLMERRRHKTALRAAQRAAVQRQRAMEVPPRFALGAPIPAPPPLRRPVIALGGGWSETWDPAGMPGL